MEPKKIFFSDVFKIKKETIEDYGALDICLVSDLPLFIDPFLLFSSKKAEYQELHRGIIRYLKYIRNHSNPDADNGVLKDLFCFHEVKQNWLGFTYLGNSGSGLGINFAKSLNRALYTILSNLGSEEITTTSHLEKVALLEPGIGKDCISDFTTNLIKDYLLEYTQTFARLYLTKAQCKTFTINKACFDYQLQAWISKTYYLPTYNSDYVILTPLDMLTKDDTWINRADFTYRLAGLPDVIDDEELRSKLNRYLSLELSKFNGKKPSRKEYNTIVADVLRKFPQAADYYIRERETTSSSAIDVSRSRVSNVSGALINNVQQFITNFYRYYDAREISSYDEALRTVSLFKDYIENKDGYLLINGPSGRLCNEKEVQTFFGLILQTCKCDHNREVNNGRGPVDYKLSYGSKNSTLIEFKLASNKSLERNLKIR